MRPPDSANQMMTGTRSVVATCRSCGLEFRTGRRLSASQLLDPSTRLGGEHLMCPHCRETLIYEREDFRLADE